MSKNMAPGWEPLEPTRGHDNNNQQSDPSRLAMAADIILPMLSSLREQAVNQVIGAYASGSDLIRPVADLCATDSLLTTITNKLKHQ